jgi:hypothetical protein
MIPNLINKHNQPSDRLETHYCLSLFKRSFSYAKRGRRDCDGMVVGFTTAYAFSWQDLWVDAWNRSPMHKAHTKINEEACSLI